MASRWPPEQFSGFVSETEDYWRAITILSRSSGSIMWSWSIIAEIDLDPVDLAIESAASPVSAPG